jgi:hypothetical protein
MGRALNDGKNGNVRIIDRSDELQHRLGYQLAEFQRGGASVTSTRSHTAPDEVLAIGAKDHDVSAGRAGANLRRQTREIVGVDAVPACGSGQVYERDGTVGRSLIKHFPLPCTKQ